MGSIDARALTPRVLSALWICVVICQEEAVALFLLCSRGLQIPWVSLVVTILLSLLSEPIKYSRYSFEGSEDGIN